MKKSDVTWWKKRGGRVNTLHIDKDYTIVGWFSRKLDALASLIAQWTRERSEWTWGYKYVHSGEGLCPFLSYMWSIAAEGSGCLYLPAYQETPILISHQSIVLRMQMKHALVIIDFSVTLNSIEPLQSQPRLFSPLIVMIHTRRPQIVQSNVLWCK